MSITEQPLLALSISSAMKAIESDTVGSLKGVILDKKLKYKEMVAQEVKCKGSQKY